MKSDTNVSKTENTKKYVYFFVFVMSSTLFSLFQFVLTNTHEQQREQQRNAVLLNMIE